MNTNVDEEMSLEVHPFASNFLRIEEGHGLI